MGNKNRYYDDIGGELFNMKVRILKCSILEMRDWFHGGGNLKELEKVLKDAVIVLLYGLLKDMDK